MVRRAIGTIAAADLFVDFLETSLRPDELLTEIRVPKIGPGGFAYEKFNRRAQDWATVGARRGADERRDARRPGEHGQHAAPRAGRREPRSPPAPRSADAAEHAADGTEPPDDLNATPAYRAHLARVLVRRALETASR